MNGGNSLEVIKSGRGELLNSTDCDEMRRFFRGKNKKLASKEMTVAEAVSTLINDGDYLAIGGFGGVRIPTAILHEIIRRKKKDLGFCGHVSTHDCQLLAAGDCFNRCDAAYIVGLEARGLSKNARRKFESGKIKVTEWTNGTLSWRLQAAAKGIPFMPCRSLLGTDTFEYSGAKAITCPFTGKTLAAVPALYPDVAVIHVHRADIYGNCQIDGIIVADDDIAKASKRVIITTEEIVGNDDIRREPNRTVIPYWCVDAVIEVPYGSYPGNMPGKYYSDEAHLMEWLQVEKDLDAFAAFLEKNIYSCTRFEDYLEKNGGIANLDRLQRLEEVDRYEP